MLFDVLKNARRVEARQLDSIRQLERALALFMMVSWHIARLMIEGCLGSGGKQYARYLKWAH
jgi:hypothetical protein